MCVWIWIWNSYFCFSLFYSPLFFSFHSHTLLFLASLPLVSLRELASPFSLSPQKSHLKIQKTSIFLSLCPNDDDDECQGKMFQFTHPPRKEEKKKTELRKENKKKGVAHNLHPPERDDRSCFPLFFISSHSIFAKVLDCRAACR